MESFIISDKFEGGCIVVDKIDGNDVYLKPDFRDSQPWFYWAFKIEGAEGKKLNFHIERPIVGRFGYQATVGYFGPAVSHDLKSWHWQHPENPITDENELYHFIYEFGKNENCVYFAHHYLYGLYNFDFDQKDGVEIKELCKDLDGTSCPYITFCKGDKAILFTARHHACESSVSYMLHGVVKEFLENPIDGYRIICVPFVDVRGVVNGDQGKGRLPHDHNRDYSFNEEPIYPTVKAIKQLVKENPIRFSFDFHDPMSAGDDKMRIVNHGGKWQEEDERLSELYANSNLQGAFKHKKGAITFIGITQGMFSTYVGADKRVRYATTIEAPYFGTPDNMMTEESYLKTGKAFAKALKKLIIETDN